MAGDLKNMMKVNKKLVEVWKTIEGYEGKYQVSNKGRIKSLERFRKNGFKGYIQKERIMKLKTDNKGYKYINLFVNGKCSTYQVHRLVAKAFIPNPFKYPQINHKDENPSNNCSSNLEWCTSKYNNNYGKHNYKLSKTRQAAKYVSIAIRNGKKASKPVVQLSLDGRIIKYYSSQNEAAQLNHIRQDGISACCCGKHKFYKGYKWIFAEKRYDNGFNE